MRVFSIALLPAHDPELIAMAVRAKRGPRILPAGPKAVLHALRSLASLGQKSGDVYSMLRSPSLWPHHVHEDIKDAWTVIAEGGFEVPGHIVAAALTTLRGLSLVPGFKVRLPTSSDDITIQSIYVHS